MLLVKFEIECQNTIWKEYIPKELHSAYSSKHTDSILFKTDPHVKVKQIMLSIRDQKET